MNLFRIFRSFKFPELIVILVLCYFLAIGCVGGGGGGEDDGGDIVNSASIGSEGGVVEDGNGARISIPAGALPDTYVISVYSYLDNQSLPDGWAPIPDMRGVIELEPEGLVFNEPVTITVPLVSRMEPGSLFPLLYWNDSKQAWEQTTFTATVATDGMSFSAEITHFSGYGGGAVENLIAGGTADAFMSEFIPWFRSNVKDLNEITEKDNECFRVTGMDFDLQYDINGENDSRFQRIGETSDYADSPLKMVDYIYDTADGHAFSGYVRITVVIYYDCTNPDFLMMADRSVLLEGESTAVEASIRCNDVPLIGKNVTFDIQSGPGVVNPGNMSTNSAGTATTTFTAGDANAVVRAYYYACEAGNSNLMERTVPIAIAADQFNLTITFEQTTSAYEIYDYFSYSGAVPIGVTNDNGDGTADVEGSNTFEVSGSGSVGDCTTTTEGAVTFTFTGTLVTDSEGKQTLQLIQSPNFSTTKTTNCPDDPPLVNPFLTGGETSSFEIPVENGYTIDQEIPAGPITSHITYILNVSG